MISVITASLPGRAAMLAECVASIAAQTRPPIEHLVGVDHARRGSAATRNALLSAVGGARVAVLDDDDVAYPHHLERLAMVDADIVYSWCDVEGRPGWSPNEHFDADALRSRNYIPITTLIRVELLRDLGGWHEDAAHGWEDWDFWLRALDAGVRFACVPEVTWRYRFHGRNKSINGVAA